MSREEDIAYDFLESDRIWPQTVSFNHRHPFMKALINVLECLPGDVYDTVSSILSFVVEDNNFTALNVPFSRFYPSPPKGLKVRIDTIVVFHPALEYPHDALVGLLAHEIAHSFVDLADHVSNEEATDTMVEKWGFGKQLKALRAEQKKERDKS